MTTRFSVAASNFFNPAPIFFRNLSDKFRQTAPRKLESFLAQTLLFRSSDFPKPFGNDGGLGAYQLTIFFSGECEMKKRLYLFLAALAMGLVFQTSQANAHPEDSDGGEKVCFCHNIGHHPHTVCTSNQALINAHMAHVNGEVPGVQDAL